jgi:hypothetical protein
MLLRYIIIKSLIYARNMWLIIRWNVTGALVSLNSITKHLNNP